MARPLTKKEQSEKKRIFLEAMEDSMGLMTTSAERAGVSPKTICNWQNSDEEFANEIKRIKAKTREYVEGQLMTLIRNGNTAAIMFYLKTQCGYRETNRVEVENVNDIDIKAAINEIKQQLSK